MLLELIASINCEYKNTVDNYDTRGMLFKLSVPLL